MKKKLKMANILKVGIRPSLLAFRQAQEVERLLPEIKFQVIPIYTGGDKDRITPLYLVLEKDFFTQEIELALLEGEIDVAIHSAKDLEGNIPEELKIVALTKSISQYEALVTKKGYKLSNLPSGSKIGTSSLKRKEAVLKFRPDLIVQDIRGNINERLEQFEQEKFDAVIMAYAALLRLGYEKIASEIIGENIIAPHPLQGSLAVEIRKDRLDLDLLFRRLDGAQTR